MMIKTRYEPYPKYKPSNVEWIGEIPEAWETKRIDWVMQYSKKTMRIESLKGKEVFHYSIPIIQETGDGQIEIADEISSDKISIKGGELLVSKLNPRKGMVLIAISKEIPIVCSSEFIPLIPKKIDLHFSFYLYSSSIICEKISSVVQSATFSHQRAKPRDISKQWFELPPLSEQRAIADFLDRETTRINGIVAKQTQMIKLLKEKRSVLITQAVTKGLDPKAKMKPSGFVWIGDIPEGWEVKKIKWASIIKNSNVNKKTEKGEKTILLCNYVDVYKNDLIDDSINFMEASATDDEIRKFILRENDVIITKDSEEWSDIAIPSFITKDFTNVICGYHLALLRPKPRDLYGKYLFRGLQSKPINTQFMVSANGITRFGLGLNSISSAYIILPPLPEQHAIADFLDHEVAKIDTLIGKIEKQIELLHEYKQSLITHAVTGRIDIRGEINA